MSLVLSTEARLIRTLFTHAVCLAMVFGCGPEEDAPRPPSLLGVVPETTSSEVERGETEQADDTSEKNASGMAQASPKFEENVPVTQTAHQVSRSAPQIGVRPSAEGVPQGAREPSYDQSRPIPNSAGCDSGMRGLTSEFPWASHPSGVWQGTDHPDPEPLQKYTDTQMLEMAADVTDESDDREHALVSIGRRRAPGAIKVLTDAAQPKERLQVREMALSGLIEHGGPDALPVMWTLLRNDPADQIRGMAIWAIALYGPSQASEAIETGLDDTAASVHGMAILATWSMKDFPDQVFPILESASASSDRIIWQEALYMLGRMPYPRAKDVLRRLADSTDLDKKNSAVLYYRRWLKAFPDLCK